MCGLDLGMYGDLFPHNSCPVHTLAQDAWHLLWAPVSGLLTYPWAKPKPLPEPIFLHAEGAMMTMAFPRGSLGHSRHAWACEWPKSQVCPGSFLGQCRHRVLPTPRTQSRREGSQLLPTEAALRLLDLSRDEGDLSLWSWAGFRPSRAALQL